MSQRKEIIILIIVLAAVFLLAFFISDFFQNKKQIVEKQKAEEAAQAQNQVKQIFSGNTMVAPQAPGLEAAARAFAERLGSFSNQSDFENMTNLYPFMTDQMRVWAENYVEQGRGQKNNLNSYYGVSSRALSSRVLEEKNNTAKVSVTLSRRESKEATGEVLEYRQDLELALIKESGGFWKIDAAQWGNKL